MIGGAAMLVEALNQIDVEYVPRPIERIELGAARLRIAVREAIQAYVRTGKMLDAALAYAAHGFPIFPLTRGKTPVPKRDKDANGEEIPGTGSFKKATTNSIQIYAWWKGHEYLIGLPMGERCGVWCLDIDTGEDHADGVAEWEKIAAQHDPIVTREHRSATGGPHLIFNWYVEQLNGCSKGELPDGISVKAEGGYIVAPPSQRKGRSYSVHSDIDPIDQPQWLTDLILQGRSRATTSPNGWEQSTFPIYDVDLDELADALRWIPNPHFDWDEWKSMALRIFAAVGDVLGKPLFYDWSQKCPEYDPRTGPAADHECWEQVKGTPPNRTGIEKIFALAREHGWTRKLRELPPPADRSDNITTGDEVTAEAARAAIRRSVRKFLTDVACPDSGQATVVEKFAHAAAPRAAPAVTSSPVVILSLRSAGGCTRVACASTMLARQRENLFDAGAFGRRPFTPAAFVVCGGTGPWGTSATSRQQGFPQHVAHGCEDAQRHAFPFIPIEMRI